MTTVAVCGLIHESNAFASTTTDLDAFVRLSRRQLAGLADSSGTELAGAASGLRDPGATPVPTTVAWAQSSGPVVDAAADELIEELVAGVRDADRQSRLDGVVVCLHGSMCSVEASVMLFERAKQVVEPSGAASLAAVLSGKVDSDRVGVILSGGNIDAFGLASVIRRLLEPDG